jgi:hypothetical protein
MNKKSILGLLCVVLIAFAAAADQGVPDLHNCYVEWAYEGDEVLSLLVVPDGSGRPLVQALEPGTPTGGTGPVVDATITLVLLDRWLQPIIQFPFEDIWLEAVDGGMVSCPGGTVADANSDLQGRAHFTQPLHAGGWSTGGLWVVLNGEIMGDEPLPLQVNSPDLDGSRTVNLGDIGLFSQDFHDGYGYRSDFNYDGVLNLIDVGYLAASIGAACP